MQAMIGIGPAMVTPRTADGEVSSSISTLYNQHDRTMFLQMRAFLQLSFWKEIVETFHVVNNVKPV